MDIGKLINKRRTELELTLEDVGNAVGVSKSTVKKWEDGFISNMKRDKIAELAKVLKLNPVSLITGEEAVEDTSDSIFNDFDNIRPLALKKFPMVGEIACGKPIFADEDHESYIMADTDIHADFCLKAKGDSMINARIFDGDIVFIKQMPMVENGEIAAVIIDNEATLKRVYYYPESISLFSILKTLRMSRLCISTRSLTLYAFSARLFAL